MKRSFANFVTGNAIATPHSFYQPPAAQATQPFLAYNPFFLGHSTTVYHPQDAQPTPYLLIDDPQDLGSEFQSNAWYHPTTGALANVHHTRQPSRPLAGLGISLNTPSSSNINTDNPQVNPWVATNGRSKSQPMETIPEVEMFDENPAGDAYSQCPGDEFIAHSPSKPGANAPYSLVDDLLMLVDSPAFSEAKMDVDSPAVNKGILPGLSGLSLSYPFDSPDVSKIGIIPDINFRALAAQRYAPTLCVNPADITATNPGPAVAKVEEEDVSMALETPALQSSTSASTIPDPPTAFPQEAMSAIVSVLAASVKEQEATGTLSHMTPAARPEQHVLHPMASLLLPAFPTRSLNLDVTFHPTPATEYLPSPVAKTPLHPRDVNIPPVELAHHQGSPVFNAHEGVELEDLQRKAQKWRKLNPGFELDKTFLQAYAGRLSERGELTPVFRCYVKGCSQSNKRRDHILVHVGSHVEHRPFQCDTCGMRFLRKNECKRHMSSHVGLKPYSCDICPSFMKKNFVRQDLLKRHMKVTHGAGAKSAIERGRKRAMKRSASEALELSPESEYQP